MQLKMSEKSLFAMLLRSPWWISFAVAIGAGSLAFALFPERFKLAGALSGAPFAIIGLIAAWKQRKNLSPQQIEAALQTLGAMSARDFTDALATAYERDAYEVERFTKPGADLAIEKNGYTTLVSCKRWKAANHGVEPLRELIGAMEKADTGRGMYVALAPLSDAAAQFAEKNGVKVVVGAELARLIRQSAKNSNGANA
jgi:restriction system protein